MSMDLTYEDNLRLNELEYRDRRTYLRSQPISFGIVIGNTCNIRCGHCYQAKNGDNLLKAPRIGRELRQEFAQFYPYLSTMMFMGGEVFAMEGFGELLDDAAAATDRPIVSVSTNGTLIGEAWAEKIVRTPFTHLAVSIDGGTSETYNRLRRGADLHAVLANIERVQNWKSKLGSNLPYLSSFFVVMRSNFREIPLYLEHLRGLNIRDVTLETIRASKDNLARDPELMTREEIVNPGEIAELHRLLRHTLESERANFRMIRFSGMTALFERHGLDAGFLEESACGLYPDSDQLKPNDGSAGFELCPNPWTTLFITENGDVRICFLSEVIGNLYETPLAALWNCPQALTMRRRMMQGRYADSGCSVSHCGWREGKASTGSGVSGFDAELRQLTGSRREPVCHNGMGSETEGIGAVRRLLSSANGRIAELESISAAGVHEECNRLLDAGQRHIDHLEIKIEAAMAEFRHIESEFAQYRGSPLVRAAHRASAFLGFRNNS